MPEMLLLPETLVWAPFGSVTSTEADVAAGRSVIVRDKIAGATTATFADPLLATSCVEVAVMTAVPTADGVNKPLEVTMPFVEDQVTDELYAPVPDTTAKQVDVALDKIEEGVQLTTTVDIAIGTFIVSMVEADLLGSWIEVAVMVAEPAAVGEKSPDVLILPFVVDQETALL